MCVSCIGSPCGDHNKRIVGDLMSLCETSDTLSVAWAKRAVFSIAARRGQSNTLEIPLSACWLLGFGMTSHDIKKKLFLCGNTSGRIESVKQVSEFVHSCGILNLNAKAGRLIPQRTPPSRRHTTPEAMASPLCLILCFWSDKSENAPTGG